MRILARGRVLREEKSLCWEEEVLGGTWEGGGVGEVELAAAAALAPLCVDVDREERRRSG